MLKVVEINYILRARIGNEIKTIKFKNYDSMTFIAKQFEEQNIDYVIIRNDDLHNIDGLLDYKNKDLANMKIQTYYDIIKLIQ